VTAKELLTLSVQNLEQGDNTGMDDDIRASMFNAAGRIMRSQGLMAESARMLDRSIELWLKQPKVPEDDVADSYNERAMIHFAAGEYEQALALTERALARRDAMGDQDSVQRGAFLQLQSVTLRSLGRNVEATAALARSVEVLAKLPDARSNYAVSLANLGTLEANDGNPAAGLVHLRQALAGLAELQPERTGRRLAVPARRRLLP